MIKTNCYFIGLLLGLNIYAQQPIRGKVTDANTKEPLAFANIKFNDSNKLQITSDIDGNFTFESASRVSHLKCTYIGYLTTEIVITDATQFPLQIKLVPNSTTLDEVLINPKENPALPIIRKTIANKKRNNPENISSFQYQCYNKIVANLHQDNLTKGKPTLRSMAFKGNPIFIMESVTKRKFLSPDVSEEEVIASKVSGLSNPSFASLATDMQPFAFYEDNIKLVNIYYLNPISNGSLNKYRYHLEETILNEKDTVFVVSFEPKRNKNFDALKGVLYINSNGYAIQNVIATPYLKAKINLKIQQQYLLVNNQFWFPDQLNYSLTLENMSQMKVKMSLEGRSYISDVKVSTPLNRKDFSYKSVLINEKATKKDNAFWERSRHEELSSSEIRTYQNLDSLGKKHNFDSSMKLIEKIAQNKMPFHLVDFDLTKTLQLNKYEGTRLGTGIYTNDLFSKRVIIGGFGGYGVNDERWKYGVETSYRIDKDKELYIGIRHQYTLVEIGNYGLRAHANDLFNLRNLISETFDGITQNSLLFSFRALRYFKGQISFNQTDIRPLYHQKAFENLSLTKYKTSDFTFYGRYAFKEKIAEAFGINTSLGSDYPVVYFIYTQGLKNLFGSNLQFGKVELAAEHSFFVKNFGKSRFRIETGYIDGKLPIGMLFTGEGSFDRENPYVAKNTFQTMKPYEFFSDRYSNLFFSHNFGTLLFKTRFFEPSLSAHHNLSWGKLDGVPIFAGTKTNFISKENVFLEGGIQLDNILKINVMNLGYLGIGAAAFHRYGYYAHPDFEDNMAYKITFGFTIR